jgi:membrane-associated phospholipid phosphatase
MSGLLSQQRMEHGLTPFCPDYHSVFPWSVVIAVADLFPIFLTVAFFAVGLFQNELFLLLLGGALFFDLGLNTGLRYAVAQPGRYPLCGDTYEMPSFSSEQATVFAGILFLYLAHACAQPGRVRVPLLKILFLNAFFVAVVGARIYLGVNTPLQLFVGSLVGLAEACLFYALVIRWLVWPRVPTILGWWPCRLMEVTDTLLLPPPLSPSSSLLYPHHQHRSDEEDHPYFEMLPHDQHFEMITHDSPPVLPSSSSYFALPPS